MATLGERIRSYRKKKKMTLEALAGESLTKGMLSLIENNKANPSMESLKFIADRLEVELTELLEEISSQELRDVLEEAEKLYNTKFEKKTDEERRLINLVKPYVDKLTHGYESARLLELYSKCLFHEKEKGWESYADQAALMYEQMNLTSKRADIGLFRAAAKYINRDYSQALNILLHERAEIEANHVFIEPMTRVDFDFHEAAYYFAIGDYDSAIRVMESSIKYSKEHRIFYRIDDLYRLAAGHAMMFGDEEKKKYYGNKLKLYGEFADDRHSMLFYRLMNIQSNIDANNYLDAMESIEDYFENIEMEEIFYPYFLISKGIALYGLGRYQEALQSLEEVEEPFFIHHPFDLSIFYERHAYEALCHMKLGNLDTALQMASMAVENITPLPHTPYKDFINETYASIKDKFPDM